MKLREIMTNQVVRLGAEESVAVAARTLTQYNIGMLPVCAADGKLRGVITDRDLVIRCVAAGKAPKDTPVEQIMTRGLTVAAPDMETSAAAALMGRMQVRRLPVVENGKLCGMVSLGDLAVRQDCGIDAADALGDICANISHR